MSAVIVVPLEILIIIAFSAVLIRALPYCSTFQRGCMRRAAALTPGPDFGQLGSSRTPRTSGRYPRRASRPSSLEMITVAEVQKVGTILWTDLAETCSRTGHALKAQSGAWPGQDVLPSRLTKLATGRGGFIWPSRGTCRKRPNLGNMSALPSQGERQCDNPTYARTVTTW